MLQRLTFIKRTKGTGTMRNNIFQKSSIILCLVSCLQPVIHVLKVAITGNMKVPADIVCQIHACKHQKFKVLTKVMLTCLECLQYPLTLSQIYARYHVYSNYMQEHYSKYMFIQYWCYIMIYVKRLLRRNESFVFCYKKKQ